MIQDVSRSAMEVRTRYLIWSSMFTEIFQTILLVRQKDFVDTFAADHLEIGYKFRPKKALIVTDERYLIFSLILSCTEIPNTISSNNIGLDKVLVHTHPSGVFPRFRHTDHVSPDLILYQYSTTSAESTYIECRL